MELTYRLATEADLAAIIRLLADDPLGGKREAFALPLPMAYVRAFQAIAEDANQELTVVEAAGDLLATFQISFLQYLTY
jgi:hypothetical protein